MSNQNRRDGEAEEAELESLEIEREFLFGQSLQRAALRIAEKRQSIADLLIFSIYSSQPRFSREFFAGIDSFPSFFYLSSPLAAGAALVSNDSSVLPTAQLFSTLQSADIPSSHAEELQNIVDFHLKYWQSKAGNDELFALPADIRFSPECPPLPLHFWSCVSSMLASSRQMPTFPSFSVVKTDIESLLERSSYSELLDLRRNVDEKLGSSAAIDADSAPIDFEYWESMSYLIDINVSLRYCEAVYCYCLDVLPSSKDRKMFGKFEELAQLPASLRTRNTGEDLDFFASYQTFEPEHYRLKERPVGMELVCFDLEQWSSRLLSDRHLVHSNMYTPLEGDKLNKISISNVAQSSMVTSNRPRLPGKSRPEQPSKKHITEMKRLRRPEAYRISQKIALDAVQEISNKTQDPSLIPWDTNFEAQRMLMAESSKDLESDEEIMDSGDLNLEQLLSGATSSKQMKPLVNPSHIYTAANKIVLRKPRYFNRVQSGFEWNKYNQTHYDQKNLPPKVIQGYKFNIFYPLLIKINQGLPPSEMITPTYRILKDPQSVNDETCLIMFTTNRLSGRSDSAGEIRPNSPYMDICFRIVNREWEYGQRRGFRCAFERGILVLWFRFKRETYRR